MVNLQLKTELLGWWSNGFDTLCSLEQDCDTVIMGVKLLEFHNSIKIVYKQSLIQSIGVLLSGSTLVCVVLIRTV